nr:GNAT family N-acetyltransferase [Kineococcus siccus]
MHWVAVEDGAVVASAAARPRGQWFGGRRLPVVTLGGVAVEVTHRGRGVGRELVGGLFAAARDAGAVACVLFPSTHRFYASLGCGAGGRRPVFALSTEELRQRLPRPRGDAVLRFAEPRDAAAVAALSAGRAARGQGFVDHDGLPGSPPEDPAGPGAFVVETAGVVTGWCLLHRKPATRAGAAYDLEVADLVAADADSELALWRGLVADTPQALRADAVVPAGSLLERRLERLQAPVENATWMLRLLDVDAALTARGWPAGVTAEVVLDVTDPLRPGDDGPRRLHVAGGRATVEPAPGAAADVAVGPGVLASLFTGHLDPVQAAHDGLLDARVDAAAVLRTLFAGPPAVLARAF